MFTGIGILCQRLIGLNQGVKKCVEEVGIGFMMSPKYHPAMKIVAPVRKRLGVKTVFNVLGPMLNPARVPFAVVGVYKDEMVSGEHLLYIYLNILFTLPYFLSYAYG